MSSTAYNVVTTVLAAAALLMLLASIAFLLGALVGWRSPFRNRRFVWSAGFFAATIIAVAGQQAVLWWVFLPALGTEMRQEALQRREEMIGPSTLTAVGETAPDFSIVADDGSTVDAAALRGKVVVLNFFATWCGPCLKELPHVEKLWQEFGARDDFSLLVVGREETADAIAEFKAKREFTFPMAADPERVVYNLFASQYIPRTYVLSHNGKILVQTVGFDDDEFIALKRVVAAELNTSK
jgi:peroxiredoxin